MLLNDSITGIVGMNVLAVVLIVARSRLFHTRLYRPMLLNVGLSVAPVLVLMGALLAVAILVNVDAPPVLILIVGIVLLAGWLLLLPNAGYLITELNLNHRRPGERVPEWYDILLVLALAMSGVLNMLFNIFLVQLGYVAIRFDDVDRLTSPEVNAVTGVVLLLAAFGIYLGRHLRLNSWDIVRPWRIVSKLIAHLRGPGAALNALGFTVTAAVFFGLMYLVVAGPLLRAVQLFG
ncbi:DUF1361 domain-containing protein [Cellulomonas denverensis]|uniref:DUF1361 domain-containing protein n=1 Tax=Cellulomonas denverensis TaxID=264297 RepID=A0A7X6KYK9_9CELL|nr:DUF1361 domain-containing protein [Cellulomonas denverensis]NKY24556.1 DUF1361 domain-containing protein [Cellulomonas denverensis]GIG27092.1 hypothetical protein Cde04nite_33360 [Cellulomonas denverensis]